MRFLTLSTGQPLPDWCKRKGWRVALPRSFDLSRLSPSCIRLSPIHPLVENQETPDLERECWYVHFLAPTDPFSVLGRISTKAYPEIECRTWFGIGLASVIVFLQENESIDRLVDELGSELLAHEIWKVDRSDLVEINVRRQPVTANIVSSEKLGPLDQTLPSDLGAVVEEFSASIHAARGWARSYAKDELPTLDQLADEVSTLVEELVWLCSDSTSQPPTGLLDAKLDNAIECRRLVQQRSDRLVQINSSLSYVISQAFFGSPPILADSALVRRHSLLGIGRAHRALNNLVREVERALHGFSVGLSIFEKWGAAPALEDFNSATEIDSSRWSKRELPDHLLESRPRPLAGPTHTSPKLVYFSGRLGFRESEYSVSAAINCLTSGDVADWHISTMTHEILHGHVRDLIHMTFGAVSTERTGKHSEFWANICRRFRKHMLDGQTEDLHLIDSVRHIFLSYCCLVGKFGSLTQNSGGIRQWSNGDKIGEMTIPHDDSELLRLLAEENRNISEIMVHTLDLFYFYFDAFERYNVACWASWRNVPAVLRDVRQYTLRVMLAATSLDGGEPIPRFARARNKVRDSLLQNETLRADPVAKAAISLLELPQEEGIGELTLEANHQLFKPFYAAVRIAELTRYCFASGKVKQELFRDEVLRSMSAEDIDFGLVPGEFSDQRLRSVAEFTAWRARHNVNDVSGTTDEERRTAWFFLACGGMSESGN